MNQCRSCPEICRTGDNRAQHFVTFRLADSLPEEKLAEWRSEREEWLSQHPEPHDAAARKDYYERFPERLQQWLDAGTGSCVLALPEAGELVENALRHSARDTNWMSLS